LHFAGSTASLKVFYAAGALPSTQTTAS